MIASPDCRLTPRKENKCPSPYPNDVKTEDRVEFTDLSPSDEDDFEEETMNELVIIKDVDSVSIANFDDIGNKTSNKGRSEEPRRILSVMNAKKPPLETDIRVKNYIETLVPIKNIRKRFEMKRREENEELCLEFSYYFSSLHICNILN